MRSWIRNRHHRFRGRTIPSRRTSLADPLGVAPPLLTRSPALAPHGRYDYSVKKSRRRASRVRMMTPLECLARLCALVPPPYYPLTRYHRVIAPCARLRYAIVPHPHRDVPPSCSTKRSNEAAAGSNDRDAPAALSVCVWQENVLLMFAPADARSRGEAPDKPAAGPRRRRRGAETMQKCGKQKCRMQNAECRHRPGQMRWGRFAPFTAGKNAGGRVRAVIVDLEEAAQILKSLSRYACEILAVARGSPSGRLHALW